MRTTNKATMIAAVFGAACALPAAAAAAQETQPFYVYITYYYCDASQHERLDQIVEQLDKPVYDAAVDDGTISAWGWLTHHTGGRWRAAQYHVAASMEALLSSQQKIGDAIEAKDKKLGLEAGSICKDHDDYIWRSVAGTPRTGPRGEAGFSTYYECDATREPQADALVKLVYAPVFDKMVADGKLISWGWLEHIVGGKYRRLANMSASDMPSLMAARAEITRVIQDDPLGDTFTDICNSHTDYMWNLKFEKP